MTGPFKVTEPDIDRLKRLLLGQEQRRLAELEQRFDARGDLADELVELLPQALTRAVETDPRLSIALQQPIREGVGRAVREDVNGFAEILFPVMGPSIRRAIAQALQDLTRSLNYSVGRGIAWRLEAVRRRVPFSELVLERTMNYRVEQALLIQSATGLVISKAEMAAVVAQDSDAFSAMLNVIQDFIRDSFDGDSQISTLELGQRTVWITPGQHAHLACVISGVPGQRLRNRLADTVDRLHQTEAEVLAGFNGERVGLEHIEQEVARCLEPDQEEREEASKATSIWPGLLLLLLLVAMAWWMLRPSVEPVEARAARLLDAAPGIVVGQVNRQSGGWRLSGLRDPLAADPEHILSAAGIGADQFKLEFESFVSLDEGLVVQRARRVLRVPAQVEARLVEGTLVLDGEAPADWIERLRRAEVLPPGVGNLELGGLEPWFDLDRLRQQLAVPAQVSLRQTPAGLEFSGQAAWSWMRSLRTRAAQLTSLPLAPAQALVPQEWAQAQALAVTLAAEPLYFDADTQLSAASIARLDELSAQLFRLGQLADMLGLGVVGTLLGFTDGTGNEMDNRKLRLQRAEHIRKLIQGSARSIDWQLAEAPMPSAPPVRNPALRRVDLRLSLSQPAGGWL